MYDAASGMAFLHGLDRVHRDLKSGEHWKGGEGVEEAACIDKI